MAKIKQKQTSKADKFLRLQDLFGQLSLLQAQIIKAQMDDFTEMVDELSAQADILKAQIIHLL